MTPKKGLSAVNRIDMNFGILLISLILKKKKMNDEGIEMVADRIQFEFQRLDEETKQWHNNKTKSTLVVSSASLHYFSQLLSEFITIHFLPLLQVLFGTQIKWRKMATSR